MNHGTSRPPHFSPSGQIPGSEAKSIPLRRDPKSGDLSFKKALPKVKRRKTKKERNNTRFHKSEVVTFPSKGPQGFWKKQDTGRNPFCSKAVRSSVMTCTCRSNPSIITQNRLSLQKGMFNHGVKSVDIERLPDLRSEKDKPEFDVLKSRSVSDGNMSLDCSICPTVMEPRTGSPERKVNNSPKSRCPDEAARAPEPAVLQPEEKEVSASCCRDGSAHHSATRSKSETGDRTMEEPTAPISEMAKEIFKTINIPLLFPGRNLVNETRKAILAVMDQKNVMTTPQPALSSPTKTDCGFKGLGQLDGGVRADNVTASRFPATKRPLRNTPKMLRPLHESSPVNAATNTAAASHGHRGSANLLLQPHLLGLDYRTPNSNQHPEMLRQDTQHILKFASPRGGPELVWEEQVRSEYFQTKQRSNLSPFEVSGGPKPRWNRTREDSPISFLHTDNSYEHIISHPTSSVFGEVYQRLTPAKRPLKMRQPENLDQIGSNVRHHGERETPTSCDFLRTIWNGDSDRKRSSETSVYYTTPSSKGARPSNRQPSQCNALFNDRYQHFQDLPPRELETSPSVGVGNHRHGQSYFMESLDQGILPTSRIPGMGTETFHGDVHFPRTSSKWRSTYEPHQGHLWGAKPTLKRDSMDNTWDRGWQSTDDWTPVPTSLSLEEEHSCNDLPYEQSLRLSRLARLSPDDWVFPRMKLY